MEATALHKLMARPDMSNHIQYFSFFQILFKLSETKILKVDFNHQITANLHNRLVVRKCQDEEGRRGWYRVEGKVVRKTARDLVCLAAATLL